MVEINWPRTGSTASIALLSNNSEISLLMIVISETENLISFGTKVWTGSEVNSIL